MEANPGRYKVVHESRGNFYVYRFKRDGTTYYHGTVPDFANPNKKQLLSVASIDALPVNSTSEPSPLAPASTPVNLEKNPGRKISHPPGITTEQTVASSHKMNAPSSNNGPTRKSILNALFLDPHSAEEDPMVDPALAASPNASTPITGNDGKGGSFTRTASRQDYLANRVTSAAIEAARILMRNLYNYAYNLSTSTAPLANAEGGVGSPVSPCGSKLPTGGGSLAAANHSNSKAGPESPVHPIRVISRSYGSFSELSEANKAASPEGVGSFSSIQLTQAPKRYTEKGCYVWDWRRVKSDTVEDAK
ncbi:unnamed protein product [Phytomonas sp. EM1]|nr:unnamed protein product [Phytomonas sp. EM1]|eukprot:CCW65623.1 unnamed protein product [Phytomonas sp. isolate EM1]